MRLGWYLFVFAAVFRSGIVPPPAAAQNHPREERPAKPQPLRTPRPRPTILDRLEQMSPEERRRALAQLPPARRKLIEQRLNRYESLSPAQREQLRRQYDRFRQLSPEKQEAARQLFRKFNNLPVERRRTLRQEARRLNWMNESERQARVNSPDFRTRYSPEEQRMVQDLVELSNEPGRP
jgi:Protein of unknown function (DUF3106)